MDKRILVIDDAKNIRLMVSKSLSSQGYIVDTAENGYEGINLFRQHDYDIVILDIRMPHLSGTEVLKLIKETESQVAVIIITAFPTVKNAVECIKLGAVDYLRKPFTPDKIKATVEMVVDRENISPANTDSYELSIQYAKKCINERKFDEAAEYLRKAVSINIEYSEPFILLGNIFELKGEYTAALKYYRVSLQLEPGLKEAEESIERIENR